MTDREMYVRKDPDGMWTLRQTRYAKHLANGKEHPHDICAVAHDLPELKSMCEKHWPNVDYSTPAKS